MKDGLTAMNRRLIDINDTLERALSKLASTNNDFNHQSQTLLGLNADLKQENQSLFSESCLVLLRD
jgi:hypothetical protein